MGKDPENEVWPLESRFRIERLDGRVEFTTKEVHKMVVKGSLVTACTSDYGAVAIYSLAGIYKWEERRDDDKY